MTVGFSGSKEVWKSDGGLSEFMKLGKDASPSPEIDTGLERMVGQSNESLKGELQEEIRNVKQTVEDLRAELQEAKQLIAIQDSYRADSNGAIYNEAGIIISTRKPPECTIENFDVDDYVKSQLFVGSTHRYLFMDTISNGDGTSYEVRRNEILLAVSVLMFQFVTYVCIGLMGFNEGKTIRKSWLHPTVEIDSRYCFDREEYDDSSGDAETVRTAFLEGNGYNNLTAGSVTADTILDLLKCSNPADKFDENMRREQSLFIVRSVAATILLASFLIGDVFQSFALWRCRGWKVKAVSAIILFEAAVAINVAFMGVDLVEELGMLSSFLLFVGLIFVHDVDEQFGKMQDLLQRLKRHYHGFQPKFWLFALCFLALAQGFRWFIRPQMSKWI